MKSLFVFLLLSLIASDASSQELAWRKMLGMHITFSRDGRFLLSSGGGGISIVESGKGSLIDTASVGSPRTGKSRGDTLRYLEAIQEARFSTDESKIFLRYAQVTEATLNCADYFRESVPMICIWTLDPGKKMHRDTAFMLEQDEYLTGLTGHIILGCRSLRDSRSLLYLRNPRNEILAADTLPYASPRYSLMLMEGDTLFSLSFDQSSQLRRLDNLALVRESSRESSARSPFIIRLDTENRLRYDVFDGENNAYLWSFYLREGANAISFSPDCRFMAYATDSYFEIANNTGRLDYTPVQAFMYNAGPNMQTSAFSPDGRHVAIVSGDGYMSLFDISALVTGVEESNIAGEQLSFSGRHIFIPGEDNCSIELGLFDITGRKLAGEEVMIRNGAGEIGINPGSKGIFLLKAHYRGRDYSRKICY